MFRADVRAILHVYVPLKNKKKHHLTEEIDIKLNYFGWHAVDVPDFDPSPGMWWFYIAQIFYNPVLAFVKASVLFFLHRLGGTKPGVHYAIWTVFTINALQAIAIFLVAVLQCLPISANWDMAVRMDADTKCVQNSFHISISCLTIFTDLLVLGLPIWMFVGLKMRVAQKIAVIGVFMLGIACVFVSYPLYLQVKLTTYPA